MDKWIADHPRPARTPGQSRLLLLDQSSLSTRCISSSSSSISQRRRYDDRAKCRISSVNSSLRSRRAAVRATSGASESLSGPTVTDNNVSATGSGAILKNTKPSENFSDCRLHTAYRPHRRSRIERTDLGHWGSALAALHRGASARLHTDRGLRDRLPRCAGGIVGRSRRRGRARAEVALSLRSTSTRRLRESVSRRWSV
jgi:hypothetical protein